MTLTFADSTRSTIGIEWELQLVDKDSNDLRQAANAVIERAWEDATLAPHIHREMLLNTVEVTSAPHSTVADCLSDIRRAVAGLRPITNELRTDVATAGSHPFAKPRYQRVTDSQRYEELVRRTEYWGRQMLLFGVHVHVGVESRNKVLPIVNALVTQAGRLQAISASSPFWAGEDTKYASNRAMVFQQLPTAGIPRQFQRWEELEAYEDGMRTAGVIEGFDEIRWDIRPSPGLGTIELRIFDACTNIREVEAVASLSHCLVDHYSSMIDAGETLPWLPDWFVAENKWRSARYGLEARLICGPRGKQGFTRDLLAETIDELRPTARRLGCERGLDYALEILDFGAAYERQRKVSRMVERGGLDAVVELMRAEMSADRPLDPEEFLESRGRYT
ncbi:glutamate--cysteine ligase [Actinomycetaceae bacterium WB03_NA08]|uniref:Putative glutamate--cysteine ligase 2 n=1 Tax=Scrofimicrobium canadense TaxID=2652290 RepID=A0A6N7W2X3_9ACTO|nr:glutamate--cysteine ligase [Scrofimicrobium canadense]MSS83761.1 glutamate--cysteine ligase [Scrofimicrobium canadense]